MKDILFSQDVVSIGEFKTHAAHWLKRIRTTGHPIVITQNRKPARILVSPADYDDAQEKERFLNSIAKGIMDANEGRLMDTQQL